ncbi:MAG: adenosylcobinamide-phosphate synthase CbiB [Sulfitobacter sp.]
MTTGLVLAAAMLLDAVWGEPAWLWRRVPHPAVLMGRLIAECDRRFNHAMQRRAKGVAVVGMLILLAGMLGWVLGQLGSGVEAVVAAILLAQRSLVQHVRAVADGLRLSVSQGRRAVAMIVSRDTAQMQPPAIVRSAIESAAENLSDGVVAPALWFLIGGLPGLLIYKVINTADSMIGYRTPQYAEFGWAAARADDLLNLVPARVTALLIAVPGGVVGTWLAIRTDARRHRSPNAGWPEAAMARAIDVALAGPRAYDGVMQNFDWVHENGTQDGTPADIDAAIARLWQAWAMLLCLAALIGILTT